MPAPARTRRFSPAVIRAAMGGASGGACSRVPKFAFGLRPALKIIKNNQVGALLLRHRFLPDEMGAFRVSRRLGGTAGRDGGAHSHGEFKVSNSLLDWFEELRLFHREDGKVVKEGDDLMSSTRCGVFTDSAASRTAIDPLRKLEWKVGC
jgi:hypothetical protein